MAPFEPVEREENFLIAMRSQCWVIKSCFQFELCLSSHSQKCVAHPFLMLCICFAIVQLIDLQSMNCSSNYNNEAMLKFIRFVIEYRNETQKLNLKKNYTYVNALNFTVCIESIFDFNPSCTFCFFIFVTVAIFINDSVEFVTC